MITKRKRTATLFFWGLVLACGSVAAQQGPGLIAKNPIRLTNVEGRMDHLGVDVKGRRLFATAFDNRTLEVIDLKTGRQIRSITGLNEPQGAYYDPAINRLVVACGGDGTVKMFDGTTYQLLQTVTLDLDADNVRYDARSNHIVVGYGGEKFLAGKVTRPGGSGALAILDTNGKQVGNIDMDASRILPAGEDGNPHLRQRPRSPGSGSRRSGEGNGSGSLAGNGLHHQFSDVPRRTSPPALRRLPHARASGRLRHRIGQDRGLAGNGRTYR